MFKKNMQKDGNSAIDHKCEKIRSLGKALDYRTYELDKANEKIHELKFKLAKQKGKNKKAGRHIAQLKQRVTQLNDYIQSPKCIIPEPPTAEAIIGLQDNPERFLVKDIKVIRQKSPEFRPYCKEEKYMCGHDYAGYNIHPVLFKICKEAGLEPVKVYAECEPHYKPFDEIVTEIKQETKEVEKEATGKQLMLLGLAKTLLEVMKAGSNFEINIQEEYNTGMLGGRVLSGREIATIIYLKN
jgi:hypothetical protein